MLPFEENFLSTYILMLVKPLLLTEVAELSELLDSEKLSIGEESI